MFTKHYTSQDMQIAKSVRVLLTLLPYVLFEKYIFNILALEIASHARNRHCASCIGALPFDIHCHSSKLHGAMGNLISRRARNTGPLVIIFSMQGARYFTRYCSSMLKVSAE